ncbi:ATP-binding protein [uncultured Maritalea sp.]|uniref:sensor histidine kinase n=1 Tax=uncultured Maritalea sp. TaxID=757249 RepID=UPI0026225540|nr:ATP-binding protein [uncultured Maritalea sp.]
MSAIDPFLKNFRLQIFTLIVLVSVGTLATLYFGVPWTEARERQRLNAEIDEVLALQGETINGIFDKFRLLTGIVARQPNVAMVFRTNNQKLKQSTAQRLVVQFAGLSGAANVQFAHPDGTVLAQSTNQGFAPQIIDERLIRAGAEGRLGRATLLTSNGSSAYGFSHGVTWNDEVIGIVVVYVDLLELGDAWGLLSEPIFVTNRLGQKIVGNQLAGSLPAQILRTYPQTSEMVTVVGADNEIKFLARSEYLHLLDWHLNVLEDYAPVAVAKEQSILIIMLSAIVVGGMIFVLLQRRHLGVIRLAAEQATARELEQRVRERTKELRNEYDERILAEAALRQAQTELMQSAKLASIGQMSAALSHEYNQPIAAIRAYADNAHAFLDQSREDAAQENLTRISSMTERMAKLSKTLKSFARKPGTSQRDVLVAGLLKESMTLVEPHAKDKKVQVLASEVDPELSVRGGSLRLSQVLVNLLSNAIDAAAESKDQLVKLTVSDDDTNVVFAVEDSGVGVSEKDRETIFDPFVTQKEVGEGLGLGLSIAYNIVHDFGGEIELGASKLGGAAFYVKLPHAKKDKPK